VPAIAFPAVLGGSATRRRRSGDDRGGQFTRPTAQAIWGSDHFPVIYYRLIPPHRAGLNPRGRWSGSPSASADTRESVASSVLGHSPSDPQRRRTRATAARWLRRLFRGAATEIVCARWRIECRRPDEGARANSGVTSAKSCFVVGAGLERHSIEITGNAIPPSVRSAG
jgi:hypothetical protein